MNANFRRGLIAAVLAFGLFSTACSESESTSDTTESAAPSPDAATTTVAPTTSTVAPTTVPAPPAFLRSDGIGPFDFGATYDAAVAGMPLTVTNDDGHSYPVDAGDGSFVTTDGLESFGYTRAREVCWADGGGGATLCAWFGGPDPASLTLVGYTYGYDTWELVGVLFSASGATTGMFASDVPAMPVAEGDCFGYTVVTLDGINLELQSVDGTPFGTYDGAGNYTPTVPAPPARVGAMRAGELPIFLGDAGDADC